MRFTWIAVMGATACAGGGGTSATPMPAAEPTPHATTGFFSAEQSNRGRENFEARCVECHGISEFTGEDFEWNWRRQTAWDLYAEMSITMPEDFPGDLDDQTYVDIIAYILKVNGYQEGGPDLIPTRESLSTVTLGPGAVKIRNDRQD